MQIHELIRKLNLFNIQLDFFLNYFHFRPENVHRLYDLVRVEDERVRPAFYFALQDTLVANDIEQATRIAYGRQRYRVVTLLGEVIEISGTMAGGGKSQMRGRIGQTVALKTNTNTSVSAKDIETHQVNISVSKI